MTWWAVDLAAYALCRPKWLAQPCVPLDPVDASEWIRATELRWAPGCGHLERDVPWEQLQSFDSDEALVAYVLGIVADEAFIVTDNGLEVRPGSVGLAVRRRLPMSTAAMFGAGVEYIPTSTELGDHLASGCADGHVHQGASLPLEVILHWTALTLGGIGRKSDVQNRPTWPSIDDDVAFLPEPLLLLLRFCTSPRAPLRSIRKVVLEASLGCDDAWGQLLDIELPPANSEWLTYEGLLKRKQEQLREDPQRWLTGLRAEAIIHAALTQRVPGLDVFVALFGRLRETRRLSSGSLSKTDYYFRAIEHHARATPELVGLELRLGELSLTGTRRGTMRELRLDIMEALAGYETYLSAGGRRLKVTFPVGFVKTGARATARWQYNIHDLLRLVEDLIDLLDRYQELRPFVDGVDVCGLEEEAPTWLFTPAYERLSEWAQSAGCPMSFRFHAGEWFYHPLGGLRAIDEFLEMRLPPGTRRRIGHGLALDTSDWSRLPDTPLVELFDDIVWAWGRLTTGDAYQDSARALEQLAYDIVVQTFPGFGLEARGWVDLMSIAWRAQLARTGVDSLRRIGFLTVGLSGRLAFMDGEPSPGSERVERFLCTRLQNGTSADGRVVEELGESVLPSLQALLADAYNVLRDLVVQRVATTQAVVEVCPTSNVLTAGIRGYSQHPLRYMLERGLEVTVNSDDPSLFHTSLREELAHVWAVLDRRRESVLRCSREVVGPQLELASVRERLRDIVKS